ncbi:hypothetical protein JTE90_017612 [Oedothorax gibbosus]|uniref:Uncharacterized protein n=1 Tax=Oedothorax gibbosus TaxID=931172 RepID=A0AAV6TFP4_9ARAC|nr:hypothetical protein JTE90_017612 [Oedothorax gibbosus]
MVRLVYAARPRSDDRFARQNRYGPPPEFPLASSCPGIVQPSFGSQTCALKLRHFHKWNAAGSPVRPGPRGNGDPECGRPPPACTFISRRAYSRPIDSRNVRLLGPCFKTGSGCTSKQPDPRRSHPVEPSSYGPRTHLGQQPPGQGDLLQSPSPARSLLNATFPHALASGGFGAGLPPVHSPLTKGIPVGSFLRLFIA